MEEARRVGENGEIQGTTLSVPERAELLQDYLSQAAKSGWRVEGKGDYIAFLASGKPVNHKLHAVLALLTGGLWLPVWAGISIFGGERRMLIRVDESGNLYGPPTRQ